MTPLERLIDAGNLRCTNCRAKRGKCDCWSRCSCGYWHAKGKPCKNPRTARCSSKMAFGKYNRRTRRYE